jgi:CRISPR-associated endonuclease Csy4
MNHYIDIKIISASEISIPVLMNELFFRLHKALVLKSNGEIAISFPSHKTTLGDIMRLHGESSALSKIMSANWLGGFESYIRISDILPVPEICTYRVVKRVQTKSSPQRLLRRSIRKGRLTVEQANEKAGVMNETLSTLPYINMKSSSTKQKFKIFIEHGPVQSIPSQGSFTAYGLSQRATIPWF